MGLQGAKILVVGGGSGIGFAVAQAAHGVHHFATPGLVRSMALVSRRST